MNEKKNNVIYFTPDLGDFYVNGDQKIYRGQNISLTCHGNGNPQPIFTWYIHGQQLETNSRKRIQENQLDVFNATITDGGEYICAAYNQVGNISRGIVVTVKGLKICWFAYRMHRWEFSKTN